MDFACWPYALYFHRLALLRTRGSKHEHVSYSVLLNNSHSTQARGLKRISEPGIRTVFRHAPEGAWIMTLFRHSTELFPLTGPWGNPSPFSLFPSPTPLNKDNPP